MTSLSLAEALVASGYQPSETAVLSVAIEAWTKWPHQTAGGARRDFVVGRLRGELTFALIEQWQPSRLVEAVGWLLARARDEIEEQKPIRDAGRKPAGGGQGPGDTQRRHAPADQSRDVVRPQAGRRSEGATADAIPIIGPPPAATKSATTVAAKLAVAARLSRLDTTIINGQPIGKLTPREVRGWLDKHRPMARFAEMIIANLPEDRPISDFITPDEADKIYQRAEAEHAA